MRQPRLGRRRGVGFRPFLTGERGGVAGPDDRGGWTGLQPGTTRADLARAAVEGVVFAVGAAADLLDVPDDGAVVLTGGGARSGVVRQLLADVLRRPVRHAAAQRVGGRRRRARGARCRARRRPVAGDRPAGRSAAEPGLRAAAERWR